MSERLTQAQIEAGLARLEGWRHDADAGALRREFAFKDFSEAFAFMTRVALAAQQADHHPDWSNSYNKVEITLSTHSAGGLTAKDMALAEAIDGLRA